MARPDGLLLKRRRVDVGPNDVIIDRWALMHLVFTVAHGPQPPLGFQRYDLDRAFGAAVRALLDDPA